MTNTEQAFASIVNWHRVTSNNIVEWAKRANAAEAEVERLRAENAELRERVAALRFACQDVVSNLEAPITWTPRDSEAAAAVLRGVLNATEA